MSLQDKADQATRADRLGRIADLLERQNIDPADIGRVTKVNLWQQGWKDADGVGQVQDLIGVQLSPSWEEGPAWPVIDQAKPVRIKQATVKKPRTHGVETAMFVPDPQIGAHIVGDPARPDTLELVPMHDETGLALAVDMARTTQPDRIVILGDWIDLGDWSLKFARTPTMGLAGQYTIDQGHAWLAQFRAACPHARIDFIAGNHESRIGSLIVANAQAAFGLRRAADPPESWPVLSVPYLLNLDALNIGYVGAYPAGEVWLRDDIRAIHGVKLSAKQQAQIANDTVSTFFGHTHRLESQTRTFRGDRGESKHTVAVTCGTLARIDGPVPSFGSGTDEKGRPAAVTEDWQAGVVFATYGPEAGPLPTVELVPITRGEAIHRGTTYNGNK